MAASLGVAHRILKWTGKKPRSGIQAAARAARYALIADACRKDKCGDLLVAHHLDDQAETFLLRLARGSGVDGLAAMTPVRDLPGAPDIRLLRPLLGIPRARLAATLMKAGLQAIEDPSNENERFERVKARRILSELRPLGLDARRLADTAAHMARVRRALEAETRSLLSDHACLASMGYVVADPAIFATASEEIALRALAEILKVVGGHDYPPRFEALEGLLDALGSGALGRGRTLHGCKLSIERGALLVVREQAAAFEATPVPLSRGREAVWDGRFALRLLAGPSGVEVRALGAGGVAALKKHGLAFPEAPKTVLATLPGLWRGEELLAVPHIGSLTRGLRAEVRIAGTGLFRSP